MRDVEGRGKGYYIIHEYIHSARDATVRWKTVECDDRPCEVGGVPWDASGDSSLIPWDIVGLPRDAVVSWWDTLQTWRDTRVGQDIPVYRLYSNSSSSSRSTTVRLPS